MASRQQNKIIRFMEVYVNRRVFITLQLHPRELQPRGVSGRVQQLQRDNCDR